jgi:hypothetical protein
LVAVAVLLVPSFRYRPAFSGSFTLDAIRHGTTVVGRRLLGQKKPGSYSTKFSCGTRRGNLTLIVVGRRPGKVQRSNPKTVTLLTAVSGGKPQYPRSKRGPTIRVRG